MTADHRRGHNPLIAILVLATLCVTGCTGARPEYEARFEHGAVAADQVIASEAGAEMLRRGGNAVDAAVATSFTLSVVRPESCGIGGGGFMVIHLAGGPTPRTGAAGLPIDIVLNYREMAPASVSPDYFDKLDKHASTHGAKAVGVPGTVAGLLYALDHYGTLDRQTVMAPAIRAAEHGFRADKHYVDEVRDALKEFESNPGFKMRFQFVWTRYLKEGRVEVGDWIRFPEQAAALRLIAEQGAGAFYEGPIADAIVETVRRDSGPLTRDDLKGFKVAPVEVLRFTFADRTFLTPPLPSSGGVVMAEALGIFARIMPGFDRSPIPAVDETAHSGVEYNHALVESLKHAFADRSRWLGDMPLVGAPVANLLSPEYHKDRAATFKPYRTLKPDEYGTKELGARSRSIEDHGTSHLCTADGWGNAVACTETINLGFGSCLAVEKYGFILNDQMDDFTTHLDQANAFGLKQPAGNRPAPGKRPLSSMTPAIVLDQQGQVQIIAGASGGPWIITGTMQTILNVLLFHATAGEAVQWPRIHHQWNPDLLRLEQSLYDRVTSTENTAPVSLPAQLERLGHRVARIDAVANVQVIVRERGGWEAACDPRKGGRPAGY